MAKKYRMSSKKTLSPAIYQITPTKGSGEFVFSTDSGYTYTVYFDLNRGIYPDEDLDKLAIYMGFSCAPKYEKGEGKHDPKSSATIMHSIANMLAAYPGYFITYICSFSNGQEIQRAILFRKWYNESVLKNKVEHKQKKTADNTYCGALYSKNHELKERMELAFEEFDFALKEDYYNDTLGEEIDDFDEEDIEEFDNE